MFALIVSLFVLSLATISNGAAIDSGSGDVSIKMIVPRGQTLAEYIQSIDDYWTPERMASAQSLDAVIVNDDELSHFDNHRKSDGVEQVLTPSAFLPGIRSSHPSTAGKAYFVLNGQNYMCSGSVVNANNKATIVTAGHCVYEYERQIWATNWIFIPDYSLGSRPFGTFVGRELATKNGWMNSRDWNYDVGIVLVNRNDKGQLPQDVVGGLGITLNAPKQATTNAFGFPKNMNNGETMSTCAGTSSGATVLAGFTGYQLACGMTGGSSGGPWIQQYNTNTKSGQQVSVNSFIISNRPGYMFGPHFTNDNIGTLYTAYQDK